MLKAPTSTDKRPIDMLPQIQKYKESRPALQLSSEVVAVTASFLSSSTCKIDFTETDLETFAYGEWKISKGAMRMGLLMRVVGIQIANDTIDPSMLSLSNVLDHSDVAAGGPSKLSLGDELALVAAGVVFFAFGAVVASVENNTQLAVVRRLTGLPAENYAAHSPLATPSRQFHTGFAAVLNRGIMETIQTKDTIEHHLLYFLVTLEQTLALQPSKRKREVAAAAVSMPIAPPNPLAGGAASSSSLAPEEEEFSRPIETYGTYPNNCPLELPKLGGRANMLKDTAAARINAVAVRARTRLFVEDEMKDTLGESWTTAVDFGAPEGATDAAVAAALYNVTFLRQPDPANEAVETPLAKQWRDLKDLLVRYRSIEDRQSAQFRLFPITSQNDNTARQNDVFAHMRQTSPLPTDEVAFVDSLTTEEVIVRVTKALFPTRGVAIDTVVQYMLCSHIDIGAKLYGACIFQEADGIPATAHKPAKDKTFGVILVLKKLAGGCDEMIDQNQDESAEAKVRASGILYAIEKASRHGILYMDSKLGNFFREKSLSLPSKAFQDRMREQRANAMTTEEKTMLQKEAGKAKAKESIDFIGKKQKSSKKKNKEDEERFIVDSNNAKNVRLIDLDGTYSFIVPLTSSTNGFKPIYYVNMALFYFALRVDEMPVSKTVSDHLRFITPADYQQQNHARGYDAVKQTSLDERLIAMGHHLSRSLASDTSSQMGILRFIWKGNRFGLGGTFNTKQLERASLPDIVAPEVKAEIKKYTGETTVESISVDTDTDVNLAVYLAAIEIGMRRQLDFRAIESPTGHIRSWLAKLFDLSHVHFAQGSNSAQSAAKDLVASMQVAERLLFLEKEAILQQLIHKNVGVAKTLLKDDQHKITNILEILQIVASRDDHHEANDWSFMPEVRSSVVAARSNNKNPSLPLILPVYPANEAKIWGNTLSILYAQPPTAAAMDTSPGGTP